MTGRDRTCDAPRFRRALYRAELRSRVEDGRSRSRTGGLLRIREALCHLSYPPSGRGWARTSSLLFVRQALSRLSYSPVVDPGQGVEPRSPRSERGVLPVRRSRSARATAVSGARGQSRNAACRIARARCSVFISTRCKPCNRASPSIPGVAGDRRSRRAPPIGYGRVLSLVLPKSNDVFYATRLPFVPGSPTAGRAHSRRSPSCVEGLWSPSLRGGVGKEQAKADAYCQRVFPARSTEGLSLSGGASIRSRACSS